jgi:thiamine biosynthesis lipoprotein
MVPAAMRRWEFPAMGTTVSVVTEATAVEQAGDEVRRLFAEWERRLSRFRPDSELSRLNADAGRPVVVSHLLFEVLEAALRAARATAGLYDPTLLRALERLGYDRSFEQVGVDVPAAPGPVPSGGGWRRVELDPKGRTVTLPPGVGVDLGGSAKGMAVDAAVERLRTLGIGAAMVSAGGDLRVHGLPPGGDGWPIAIEGPRAAVTIALTHGLLATSGIGRRRWRQGEVERHHLLDPRHARPAQTGRWSVTVAAATCAQAEVAAKTAFILGPSAGTDFLERKRLAGLLVARSGA